jgi:uncharacterized alpha-E superfamily protein
MLSRVAERIYWMARYVERTENTARLISVNAHLVLDMPKAAQLGWEPLVDLLGARSLFYSNYGDASERNVVRFLVHDGENPGSIPSSLQGARENARTIRDVIPAEAWEQVNELYLTATRHVEDGLSRRHRFDYLTRIILGAQTITGILAGTMNHDAGYSFLRLGRNLERADMTSRIVDLRSRTLLEETSGQLAPFENIQWVSLLKSLSAFQMYRRKVGVDVDRADVLGFLLRDVEFPRSFGHCLEAIATAVAGLPRNSGVVVIAKELHERLASADPETLVDMQLQEFMDELQKGLIELHNVISDTYFLH